MQRYFVNEKKDNYLYLNKDDIHHIKNVMRNNIGDNIECVYNEELYIGKISDTLSGKIEIIKKEEENNEMKANITVAISLVTEQKMDLILQKLTELGVKNIIPIKTENSIVNIKDDSRINKKLDRWQKICKEASEQSKRNTIPKVHNIITLKELKNIENKNKFFCSTTHKNNIIKNVLNSEMNELIFVIGPEGGFSKKEEEYLESINYTPISLGNRILRVETAAFYIGAITSYFYN